MSTAVELQTVPRMSHPAELGAWFARTASLDEPGNPIVEWAQAVTQLGSPTTQENPPMVANLVTHRDGVAVTEPLAPDTGKYRHHPSWDIAQPSPGPGGKFPSWWTAGLRADMSTLVMRAELTASELRGLSRQARSSGMSQLATSLDKQARAWAQTAHQAFPYAISWELRPAAKLWEQLQAAQATQNPPMNTESRRNSWH